MSDEEASVGSEVEDEEVTDLSDSDVCTKYQEASKIANLALTGLVSQCIPGAKIIDLCQFGTAVIDSQTSKLYNKKVNGIPIEKGVAFPVCVSVNDIVCNHSPLKTEELVRDFQWSEMIVEGIRIILMPLIYIYPDWVTYKQATIARPFAFPPPAVEEGVL
mmetsp:Transcript_160/g.164  ORF Transcript_160/g.164 Transcript_160/m.164 type:complete len:161 (+) Transcript_160:103-585(+)